MSQAARDQRFMLTVRGPGVGARLFGGWSPPFWPKPFWLKPSNLSPFLLDSLAPGRPQRRREAR